MKILMLVMSMLLSIASLSCSDDEELFEPVKQEVKTDDKTDDNKACDNPRASVEYQNLRAYGECLSGVARR